MQLDASLWPLVGVPLLIFVARLIDVGLGTLRIALVARGQRRIAPLVGFFESLIWLIAISQVVQHLNRPVHYLAWASGYAFGTWAGLVLEEKLALGTLAVRVITTRDAEELIVALEDADFAATSFAARGLRGRVRLILSILRRRDLPAFCDIVRKHQGDAFLSVSDVRSADQTFGLAPSRRRRRGPK